MITDWKTEIAIAWRVLQAIQDVDREGLWNYSLPRVAATEQELRHTEEILGFRIDHTYRTFLTYANGWSDFYHSAALFGTDELRGGELMERAKEILAAIDETVWQQEEIGRNDVLPLAVSKADMDVFVIVRPSCERSGQVIWFAGTVIDRFRTFDDFFLGMVDYNRLQLQRMTENGGV